MIGLLVARGGAHQSRARLGLCCSDPRRTSLARAFLVAQVVAIVWGPVSDRAFMCVSAQCVCACCLS